jgi:hypothetical protein
MYIFQVLCRAEDSTENSRVISAFINEVENLFQENKTFPVVVVATCNGMNKYMVSYSFWADADTSRSDTQCTTNEVC